MTERTQQNRMKETRQVLAAEALAPVIFDVVENGGTFPLTVTGTSMRPTLHPHRDKVFLVSPKQRTPRKKEIVFFQRDDGAYVLHRIVGTNKTGKLKINGDAQTWTEWIQPEQVIAVVDAIERKGKYFSVDSNKYQRFLTLWGLCRPIRKIVFSVHSFLGRGH